jgi:Secretion system C-terminal sorting domain/PKD domain
MKKLFSILLVMCLFALDISAQCAPFSVNAFQYSANPCCPQFTAPNDYQYVQNGSVSWSFGDGTTSSSMSSVQHCYTSTGTFPVSHTVILNNGSPCTTTNWITISSSSCAPPPTCTLQAAFCSSYTPWVYDYQMPAPNGDYIFTRSATVTINDVSAGNSHSSSWVYTMWHYTANSNIATSSTHWATGPSFTIQVYTRSVWHWEWSTGWVNTFEADEFGGACLTVVANSNSQCTSNTCSDNCNNTIVGGSNASSSSLIAKIDPSTFIIPDRQFKVYPNPVVDGASINIKLPYAETLGTEKTYNCKLLDINGRVLISKIAKEGTLSLPTTDFAKGIYLLQVTDLSNKVVFNKRILVN